MRRRWLLVVLAGLAVLAVGTFVLWPRPDRVTRDNFRRITVGMDRAEVEALFGPPGDYRTIESAEMVWGPKFGDWLSCTNPRVERDVWEYNTATVEVMYSKTGTVRGAMYFFPDHLDEGPLGFLQWRLERQWHRWFP